MSRVLPDLKFDNHDGRPAVDHLSVTNDDPLLAALIREHGANGRPDIISKADARKLVLRRK